MFHFLVKFGGWGQSSDLIDLGRAFEYTDDEIVEIYKPNGNFDRYQISREPALFASETGGSGEQLARVGYINNVVKNGKNVNLSYTLDPTIPPISNEQLSASAINLGIGNYELSRTHWAIKDIDLYQYLYTNHLTNASSPDIFSTEDIHNVENDLLSVMMPFSGRFDSVYQSIQAMAASQKLRCLRADDIWLSDVIVQDVVSLICRSKIVICDCTNRNPNVFYEAGIAHALGKSVILITQSEQDIPFDLRHLRYLPYLNNNEGREELTSGLIQRVLTINGS